MIDILIPTYNRDVYLLRNLHEVAEQVRLSGLQSDIRILVSDNASTDATASGLSKWASANPDIQSFFFHQSNNVGLEANALSLLSQSRAEFVLYLGDDDYLPPGYLKFLHELVLSDRSLGVVIPGFSALNPDGSIKRVRHAAFQKKNYSPGFFSVLCNSQFGHQLSGLLLRREGLLESYIAAPEFRNIYLFIFFVGYAARFGSAYYCPRYQVQVSVGNSKDWKYDASGLLKEIFKNYYSLYRESKLAQLLLCLHFSWRQWWRLRGGKRLFGVFGAMKHLLVSNEVPSYVRITFLLFSPVIVLRTLIRSFLSELAGLLKWR